MNGAIELPGEANPLTPKTLLHTLHAATLSNSHQAQTSTKQLRTWETEPGFYSLLQDAFLELVLPHDMRMLAIIQLKNGVDKYWRKSATNAIRREEKANIRSKILQASVNEADAHLSSLNSLAIAKIARFDFPSEWPDLVPQMLESVRASTLPGANPQHLSRALDMLLSVVKEFTTLRLQRSKASLQSVTPGILHVVQSVYLDKVEQWQASLSGSANYDQKTIMSESLSALKIVRNLILAGYEFPSKEKAVQTFWETSMTHMDLYLRAGATDMPDELHLLALKQVVQFSKLHLELAKTHPTSFAFLPGTIPLVRNYWKYASMLKTQISTAEKLSKDMRYALNEFILNALKILRASFKIGFTPPPQTFKYRHSEDREEPNKARELIKRDLLTDEFVIEMMQGLIMVYFTLSTGDLEEWDTDPEQWEEGMAEMEESYEFDVRSCSERLFLDMSIHCKATIAQPLLEVIAKVSRPDFDDMIVKDAVYSALGLAAPNLHTQMDFNEFLNNVIVADLQHSGPDTRVLRRRIALLIAQWIQIGVADSSRPLVYQIYRHLLNGNDSANDDVVLVTAGRRFKDIASEWEFKAEHFAPFASDILGELMSLIEETDRLVEPKMALLETISVIVERMGEDIEPFANKIVEVLPVLWRQVEEMGLMPQAVMVTYDRLIRALKAKSAPLHEMVLPMIRETLDPHTDLHDYLLEDALDLWHAVLTHAVPPLSDGIISTLPALFPIFETGSTNRVKALEISTSFLLLAPAAVLADDIRNQMLSKFTTSLEVMKSTSIHSLTKVVELAIRCADKLGGARGAKLITDGLLDAGFLITVLEGIRGNWEAHLTTGPHRKDPVIDTMTESSYLCIISRIILTEGGPQHLFGVVKQFGEPYGESADEVMKWLLEEWFSHMDFVSAPTENKLLCLALTKLLTTEESWILERLQDLMSVWTEVVVELQDGDDEQRKGSDSLVYDAAYLDEIRAKSEGVPEELRSVEAMLEDPVHSVNSAQYIGHHLKGAMQASGGEQAFVEQWAVNVDAEVLQAFSAAVGIM